MNINAELFQKPVTFKITLQKNLYNVGVRHELRMLEFCLEEPNISAI